jgi:ribonuclease HII
VGVRVLGIDEAGRGCVLGALVVGAFVSEAPAEVLRAAGADDSKRLSAKRREQARARLAALGAEGVRVIPATAIDAGNLNELEEEAIVSLVVETRPDHVVLDARGPVSGLGRAVARLSARWRVHGLDPAVTIAPKADATHPVCGAASIVAKTTRDALLAALDARHGPFGSGYPSDPTTRAWLVAWARTGQPWPDFVRSRWGTVRDLTPTTRSG